MRSLHRIAEGGQVWAHRVRMFRQVLRTALLSGAVAMTLVFAFHLFRVDGLTFWGLWYRTKAYCCGVVGSDVVVDPKVWSRIDRYRAGRTSKLIAASRVKEATDLLASRFWKDLISYATLAVLIGIGASSGTLLFFLVRGGLSGKKEVVEGQQLMSSRKAAWRMRLGGVASPLKVGSLPIVKESETQHILISGGTGSGKTNCLHHLLPQIRSRGDRVVLVDTTGTLLERYYREEDSLLQPGKKASLPWHPWSECTDRFDRESLSESLIPISHHDQENYWRSAARVLLSSLLEKLDLQKRTTELTRWLLYAPLRDLCLFVQETRAASVLDISAEKTAASVRSVAATFVDCLDHLDDTDNPFSIRDWIAQESGSRWLFLSCTQKQRASFRPLLGCWLSTAIRSLLQLTPDFDRRVWLVIDELPTLHKVKDLEVFLAEGRKYGVCGVVSIQSPSQLDAIYGRDVTQVILGNCATKVAFAERDPEVAQRISRMFGQHEVREFQEGISYGAHQMRDGVSISNHSRQRPIVSPSAIQSLEPNQAYVKLLGCRPIVCTRIPIVR